MMESKRCVKQLTNPHIRIVTNFAGNISKILFDFGAVFNYVQAEYGGGAFIWLQLT